MIKWLVTLCICLSSMTWGASPQKVRTLYNSLRPDSIPQLLAFYELYPHTQEGEYALQHAWQLLAGKTPEQRREIQGFFDSKGMIDSVVQLVNKQPGVETPVLSEEEIATIEWMASHLPNRFLKGHHAKTEAEVQALPPEEIDLARGLFLTQMGEDAEALKKIRSYEATLDLMALQIGSQLDKDASPEEKIRAINTFIFDEMQFRFPPHSLYAKDIDVYTFLPSVLDSRRGVCLGVSILYLCLAQRLSLSLEMITPPGHIYIRYQSPEGKIINIETTARGIDVDSEVYLSVGTRSLQERNIKEVIGMAHFNQASVYWQYDDYEKALASYRKAEPYIPGDQLLQELLSYALLANGKVEEGKAILEKYRDQVPDHAVVRDTMTEDYLNGDVDIEGILALFMHVDETRESILEKKASLEKILQKCPRYRAGHLQLATIWLQLHRAGEALQVLEHYAELAPGDPVSTYYLAMIYTERFDYQQAWSALLKAEEIVHRRDHNPKALTHLRRHLTRCCPE